MFLVHTKYIQGICLQVDSGIYQVYTRYIPGLEIHGYIPGMYLVYNSYIADMVIWRGYTRYIPGKCHFWRFQMGVTARLGKAQYQLNWCG